MSCLVEGAVDAPVLVIGMAPGRDELAIDRPFMGGSGRLLWGTLGRVGIDRSSTRVINTIGEWPLGSDGNPTTTQYADWWERFNEQINASSPQVVLLLGKAALWRYTGITEGIEAWRGYIIGPEDMHPLSRTVLRETVYKTSSGLHKKGDTRLVKEKTSEVPLWHTATPRISATFHPAAVLRSGFSNLPAFNADIQRVARLLRGELNEPRTAFSTTARTGVQRNTPSLSLSPRNGVEAVAFDIETRRDSTGNDVIERVGVSDHNGTWTALWDNTAIECLIKQLRSHGTVAVAHNIAFDAPRLGRAGCEVPEPWWDTMLAANLLQPDLFMGLNAVASLYLDTHRWKHLNASDPERYNAMDANATYALYHTLRQHLDKTGQTKLFEQTIMRTVPTLVRMTQRGIKMDQGRRATWLQELQQKEQRLAIEWDTKTGGIALRSPKQLAAYLYGQLGLPTQYNKYGGVTCDASAVVELRRLPQAEQYRERLELLGALREVSKLRSTYAENPISDDGCVHPSYLPTRKDYDAAEFGKGLAGTGRITSRDPNIQNQPTEARKLYVSHRRELILVEADYSQIELRIAGTIANDLVLLEALKGDVHANTMAAMNIDRTRAKNLLYGTLYGAGPRRLVQVLRLKGFNITEREAKEMQNGLRKVYPKLWAWRERVVGDVAVNYYCQNPFNRRRYFFRGAGDAPAAIDFYPQSSAADIMWRVLRQLEDELAGIGGELLTTVHDSILWQSPAASVARSIEVARIVMEQPFDEIAPGFRVPVVVKTGSNWGEMHEVVGITQ